MHSENKTLEVSVKMLRCRCGDEVINNILDVSLLPPINVSTSESSLSGISDNNDSVGPLKL